MSIKEIKQKNLRWINVSEVGPDALAYLKDNFQFHPLDLEDVMGESQTPKIDIYKEYLFLILHFPEWKAENKKVLAHEIDFFVGPEYLITIQNGKDKEVKDFFYNCINNKAIRTEWMNQSSGYLLYRLLEALFSRTRPLLNDIGKQISDAENKIFAGNQDVSIIRLLSAHRRNVQTIRRMIDPQRYLMSNLSHIRKLFLDEQLSVYFDNLKDYLDKLWSIADSYKETIESLHHTVESILNQTTNKVLETLTFISVALLPLTLFSGIYGMNIAGLPFAEDPTGVWILFSVLTVFVIGIIVYMKKRWLK